ncbi:hypothetical protein QBC38DRAFT_486735 [Podospora fimiseda]|uniref:AB hydrolase-1 domain-containing protein n=1 Tax=Podospora fimiseda TaxID=252190 RepID=A0AAN7GPF7_9PEZI|nr:hypothetical protein QBC38DRAFT_486735 [Podospora fimiseda]
MTTSDLLTPETLPLAGLQTDVYGLSLLSPSATQVTCLWLHHQRTRSKESMREFASLILSTYYSSSSSSSNSSRGLICLAYDQRNHGTRTVNPHTTGSWRDGNPNHAVDMWGMVNGMVADQSLLIDLVEGYLFPEGNRSIGQHLVLGVSLGGHSAWQTLFKDKRVRASVAVIGCPDYMELMSDRARLSRLQTWGVKDNGAKFLGSRDFPRSLVEACKKGDPKGLLFGAEPIEGGDRPGSPTRASTQAGVRQRILYERLEGKRVLVCAGEKDKLVPMRCSEPFMSWLKGAVGQAPPSEEQRILVDERIYEGVGHDFSEGMVKDAVEFLLEAVEKVEEDKCNPLRRVEGHIIPAKV